MVPIESTWTKIGTTLSDSEVRLVFGVESLVWPSTVQPSLLFQ